MKKGDNIKKAKEEKIKIPFHPIIILLFSVLFTFLVGGIVTAINWTRLSRPKWKYPTIGISLAGFILFMFLYSLIPASLSTYIIYGAYIVFAAVGAVFYFIQKPYYDLWKMGKL